MRTVAELEALAEGDEILSTNHRKSGKSNTGPYGSYRSQTRGKRRRRQQILRRRMLLGGLLLTVILLLGGIIFGITGSIKNKKKRAFLETGIACMAQQNYEQAIVNFEKELETAKNRVGALEKETLLYRAEAEYMLEDYPAALHTYQLLLELEPENAIYQKGTALALMENGDLDGALALHVIDAAVYNRMAKEQIDAGQYEKALTAIEQGLAAVRSEDADAQSVKKSLLWNQAVAYEYQGDFQRALELLETYARDYGSNETIEHELTFLKTRQGQ